MSTSAYSRKRRLRFEQWNIFTSRPLEGNPVAVFHDARALTPSEMQALAREINFSETVFVIPRDRRIERQRGVLIRIFTPREELPFAGHPTLGAATTLHSGRYRGARELTLDLPVGPIPVSFRVTGRRLFAEMQQIDPRFGEVHEPRAVAPLVGLELQDLATDLPIETVSTGLPYVIVPVRSLDAIGRLRVDWVRTREYLENSEPSAIFYCVSRETSSPKVRLRARCIDVENEDPATGSAAGCAAAWMLKHGVARPGERAIIEQGIEIGRPSRIFVRAARDGEYITDVRVGGFAVQVMSGEYRL